MSASATELVLIRHGQTDLNREPRFQGQIDTELNRLGLLQARRLAQRLSEIPTQLLTCSDLIRTRQTAAPSADLLQLQATPMPLLREQGFGIFEGLSFGEATERHPQEWSDWLRQDPDYAPPGGETRRAFHGRVTAALLALARSNAGRSVAVVTHGGVLDMVWRSAKGLSLSGPYSCPIPNAGINRIRVRGDSIEVISWADDAHVFDLNIPA